MAFGDIAKLLASLDLDTKPFERNAKRVGAGLDRMETGMGRVSTRSIALGTAIGTGIERLAERGIGFLFSQIQQGEEGLRTLQNAQAQTAAVIESTGGAAGVTAQQVRDLAESIESLTTADDKSIQQGENLLLTFTGIGKDVFPTATKAMVNMAIALNKGNAETADFDSAAIQLGKALNDPIKGLTALRRVGVSFTKDQEKQIKALVESGDVMGAQKVILAELEKEFGKAGEAAGKSGAAGLVRLHDAVEDAQIALAEGLAPALEDIRGEITRGLADPGTQQDLRNLGRFLGDAAKSGLAFAKSIPWGQVADGLRTAAGFAGTLIKTFTNLPPGVQATIIGLAGLNKLSGGAVTGVISELGKGLIKGILGINAGVVNVKGAVVNGAGGVGAPAGGAAGGLGVVGKLFLVGEAIGLIAAVEGVREAVLAENLKQAQAIGEALDQRLATDPTRAELNQALAGIDQGLRELGVDPLKGGDIPLLADLVAGPTIRELQRQRAEVVAALDNIDKNTSGSPDERDEKDRAAKQQRQFDTLRDKVEAGNIASRTRLDQVKATEQAIRDKVEAARSATVGAGNKMAAASANAADRIVRALYATRNQPIAVTIALRGGGAAVAEKFYISTGKVKNQPTI